MALFRGLEGPFLNVYLFWAPEDHSQHLSKIFKFVKEESQGLQKQGDPGQVISSQDTDHQPYCSGVCGVYPGMQFEGQVVLIYKFQKMMEVTIKFD